MANQGRLYGPPGTPAPGAAMPPPVAAPVAAPPVATQMQGMSLNLAGRLGDYYSQGGEERAAANVNTSSVGVPLAPGAPPRGVSTNNAGQLGGVKGQDIGPGYNPAAGQYHIGLAGGNGAPSGAIINPATGQVMTQSFRDAAGNLTMRPGEQGFQSSQQRVNLDPYAQRLSQVGDIQMQRGLSGATLAGMPQVEADKMRAAQIDQSGFNRQAMAQDQLARQGQQAIDQMQSAALGQAPSVAALQQRQGIEQAQQAAMATAASARGGADQRAAAMRQGQQAGADIAMQGVGQAAALRANEMANARGQLVGAIGQQQGLAQQQGASAAQLAAQQAQLGQQAGLANQGSNLQASMANQQGYFTGAGMDQATLGMGAGLYQQGAGLGIQGVDYNNQRAQQDFNQQMQMQDAQTALYGISQGVAAQRYQADQAANAATTGALINAGGQVLGASMQAFAPQQQPRRY